MQPGTVMLVPSTNIFAQDISRQLTRSFMYIRKSKGPSIRPWGTLQVNLLALENAPLSSKRENWYKRQIYLLSIENKR